MTNSISEQRPMSRVQHVQEMRRQALSFARCSLCKGPRLISPQFRSRLRGRIQSPPSIVVIEPSSSSPGSAGLQPSSRDPPKLACSPLPATPLQTSSPRGPFDTTHLHAHSALERRFTRTLAAVHDGRANCARSCPTSPAPASQSGVVARALVLRPDATCHSTDYRHLEIAMEVAEETARICNSPGPVQTDVPLVYSGLSPRTADELKMWLMVRFNYRSQAHALMDESVTPEILAHDILGPDPFSSSHSCWCSHDCVAGYPKRHRVWPPHSGTIPVALRSPPQTPLPRIPEPSTPNKAVQLRRRRMRKDLTINLTCDRTLEQFPSTAVPPSTTVSSPLPSSQRGSQINPSDFEMAEPRSGKKAGWVKYDDSTETYLLICRR